MKKIRKLNIKQLQKEYNFFQNQNHTNLTFEEYCRIMWGKTPIL
jgi:hypothetical protein